MSSQQRPSDPPAVRLGTFHLTMITMSIIVGVQLAPEVADEGMSVVFYVLLAFAVFAIPAGLIVSQLVTTDPRPGGVYSWAREAFGERWGFVAVWLQWAQALLVMPALLAVSGASALFALAPGVAENRFYLAGFVVAVFWLGTAINLRGMSASARISTLGVLLGVAVPALVLLVLGVAWVATGRPEQIDLTLAPSAVIPDLGTTGGLSFVTVSFFLFVGTEIPAAHVREVDDPRRSYPIAIFSAVAARALVMISAALTVAILVPVADLSFVAGLVEAMEHGFESFGLDWVAPIVGAMVGIGVYAQVSSLMVGPSRALHASGEAGDIPPRARALNADGMPSAILGAQALVATVLAVSFLVFPTVSDAFFVLNQLGGQLYMTMYVLLFVTAIVLYRRRAPGRDAFRIPGGTVGTWIAGLVGAAGAIFAVITGFFPPDQFQGAAQVAYYVFLVVTLVAFLAAPFLLVARPESEPAAA